MCRLCKKCEERMSGGGGDGGGDTSKLQGTGAGEGAA